MFIESNIIGNFNILQVFKITKDPNNKKIISDFHVSTDEVFDPWANQANLMKKQNMIRGAHTLLRRQAVIILLRSYYHSYNLPIVIKNCSNKNGPYQFPEKLIPISITRALKGENILIYGNGNNVRDWIYVEDHIDGLLKVASKGDMGKPNLYWGEVMK